MKKILLFTTLVITLLIPLRIKAVSISSSSITGSKEKSIGEEFPLTFKINFSGLEKGQDKTIGIWRLVFKIDYDDEVFSITKAISPNINSAHIIESGKHYIYAEVPEYDLSLNSCANGQLYCGNYEVNVNFVVKNTGQKMSTISMKEIEVQLLNMHDLNKEEYTDEDAIEITGNSNQFHTVTIKSTSNNNTPKQNTTTNNTNSQENNTVQQKENSKSSNTYLKSLEIENYKINFRKSKKEYTVYIDEDVNSLNIKAETYDSKAKYKVIGAEDLKANNNKVSIEVTAEDNTKETYILNIKIDGELKKKMQEKMTEKDTPKEKEKNTSKLDKKTLTKIGIITGLIALIGVVSFIIYKIKNRKMDKILDEL